MRLIHHPVTQFLAIGFVTVGAIVVGVNFLAVRAASEEADTEATRINEVLAHQVAEPVLPRRLASGSAGAADRLDHRLDGARFAEDLEGVDRVTIRSADGRILYASSEGGSLIGATFPLDEDQQRVLDEGGSGSQSSDPSRPENQADGDRRIEIYTQIVSPEGEPLLFDAYYSLNRMEQRQNEIFSTFRWIVLAPLVLLIVLATLILSALTRQLTSSAKDRERLLQSAINASDAERRRIARDLHDGVVQDLAGTAFSISAVARSRDTPAESRTLLEGAGGSLRDSLTALRSLLAEIHPPNFHADGLAAALDDLIAPASTAGIQASASVKGTADASDAMAALVWRVAQELVRNAIRHSRATTLAVTVRGDADGVLLEVVDDGVGFDPAQLRDSERYGLRGLRSLVTDVGGVLEVHSAPGEGTTVRMRVKAT